MRWTPETEEILAKALVLIAYQAEGEDPAEVDDDWSAADEENRAWVVAACQPVLAALADAGVLLPPGGESYDQYRTGDKLCCQLEAGSPNFVHDREEARHTHSHRVTTWPDGAVLTGPWIEVEP